MNIEIDECDEPERWCFLRWGLRVRDPIVGVAELDRNLKWIRVKEL
jgi:hypothetical protein